MVFSMGKTGTVTQELVQICMKETRQQWNGGIGQIVRTKRINHRGRGYVL